MDKAKAIVLNSDFWFGVHLMARIVLLILSLGIGMAVLLVSARDAMAANLKVEGVIRDDYIRLGDLFEGLDQNADYILGPAPQPGKDIVLNARTLYRIASAMNVSWNPSTSGDQIVLRREAEIIPPSAITAVLEKKIEEKAAINGPFTISYGSTPADIILPGGSADTVEISDFSFNPRNDSFNAVVVAPSIDNPLKRVTVNGQIERLVQVPVLSSTLRNGDIIAINDIDFIEVLQSKVPNGAILKTEALNGMTPRRVLSSGRPITTGDITSPMMVQRGDIVTLVFVSGGMTLTAKGKALQNGASGESIRVANLDSSKNLQGTVTGTKEITIR